MYYIINVHIIKRWESLVNVMCTCDPQNGKTAVDIAVEKGHKDLIEVLKKPWTMIMRRCTSEDPVNHSTIKDIVIYTELDK